MVGKIFMAGLACLLLPGIVSMGFSGDFMCEPTQPDALGPYYKPDAPVRDSVGTGYVLEGEVKSAADCSPISDAKIEFWLTGPDGNYDDEHRATLFSGSNGEYRFQSNYPESYGFRPPHIHIQASAESYETIVTQHYPKKGAEQAAFDLVLAPKQIRILE